MITSIACRPALAAAALALWGMAAAAQSVPSAVGHWEGKVQYGDPPLPVTVDLARNATGTWIGTFGVPGTTTADVPLENIMIDKLGVRFTLALPDKPSFEGTLADDGNALSGTAANSQGSARFDLVRKGEPHVNVPPPSSAIPEEFLGRWEGTLEVSGQPRRVGLRLVRAADSTAAGTLVSIDQGNQEFPVTTTTIAGKDIQLQVRALSGSYKGTLGAGGEIAGEWSQGGQRIVLTFKRVVP